MRETDYIRRKDCSIQQLQTKYFDCSLSSKGPLEMFRMSEIFCVNKPEDSGSKFGRECGIFEESANAAVTAATKDAWQRPATAGFKIMGGAAVAGAAVVATEGLSMTAMLPELLPVAVGLAVLDHEALGTAWSAASDYWSHPENRARDGKTLAQVLTPVVLDGACFFAGARLAAPYCARYATRTFDYKINQMYMERGLAAAGVKPMGKWESIMASPDVQASWQKLRTSLHDLADELRWWK
jgi:hypothetical protein